MTSHLDQRARACYRDAEQQVSARTMAELHRRRIAACTADGTGRAARAWFGWPLATAFAGICALALGLGVSWSPAPVPADAPMPAWDELAVLDAADTLEALDVLDTLNLTALDEDSEFFLWLAAHEASLLAME